MVFFRRMRLFGWVLMLFVGSQLQGQTVEDWARMGWEAFGSGDFAGAERYAGQAIDKQPGNPEHHYCRGAARLQMGSFQLAEVDFGKAIDLGGGNLGNYHFGRGNARIYLEKYKGAILDLELAHELLEPDADVYQSLALAYRAVGNPGKGLSYLDSGLVVFPEHPELHHSRAVMLLEQGNRAAALEEFNYLIQHAGVSAVVLMDRAFLLFELGRYEAALEDLDAVLASEEEVEEAQYYRAQALRMLNRYPESSSAFRSYLEKRPDDQDAWLGKAFVDLQLEQYAQVVSGASKALELESNAAGHSMRGIAYAHLQHFEKALVDLDRAVEMEPGVVPHVVARGQVRFLNGDLAGALKDYGTAISAEPGNALHYYSRAEVHTAMGNAESANKDLQRAKQLESKSN